MSSDEYFYVVFTPCGDHWVCKYLHPDFRHCYLIKAEHGRWIVYGKCADGLDLLTLPDFSASDGNKTVVKAEVKDHERGLFMLNTCVGHIKQALGIRNPFILTPYQLYTHLMRR